MGWQDNLIKHPVYYFDRTVHFGCFGQVVESFFDAFADDASELIFDDCSNGGERGDEEDAPGLVEAADVNSRSTADTSAQDEHFVEGDG